MAKDWTLLYKKYKGLWVALAADEKTVLGTGRTVSIAVKEAKKKTDKVPFLTHIPKNLTSFVGSM